jgi:hypothetical protein
MPNALTNTNISATYKGVLHTNGTTIPPTGQEAVYDGVGVQSSLSVGRAAQGASITGLLSANNVKAGELLMPNKDGAENQVVARTAAGVLELKSLSEIIGGSTIEDGVYDNPRITVVDGVITNITSRPTLSLLSAPVSLITPARLSINSYLGVPNTVQTIIPNTNINWSTFSGYVSGATARYAIINTKLFLQSNGGDFAVYLKMDGKTVCTGEVREDYRSLGVDTIYDSTQQFFAIPATGTSSYYFEVQTLAGSTNNTLNLYELNVTLDGWVY